MKRSSIMALKKSWHCYTFEVNYAKLKDFHVKIRITSPAFYFDGYKWVIHYFPKHKTYKDYQFISLELLDKVDGVSVGFSFFLHNKNEIITKHLGNWFYTFYETDNTCGQDVRRSVIEELANADGNFYILCKIIVTSGPRKELFASGGLREDIRNLFDSAKNFDVTFEVEGDQIPAHKVIVAARSPVLNAELFGFMEEADMNFIKIKDMKAYIFKAMLRFMYTDEIFGGGSTNFSIEFFLELYAAADYYAVEKLKGICIEKLTNNLTVQNVATVLVFADRHSCAVLKETCLKFASEPENFMQLALTEGYIAMIEALPSLLVELRGMVNCHGTSKKQKSVRKLNG